MRLGFWLNHLLLRLSTRHRATSVRRVRRSKASNVAVEILETRRMLSADAVAVGGETQVNTHTAGDQRDPAIAADAAGDYVVAWSSSAQDGSGSGIYAQRYTAAGFASGNEFQANTYTKNDQRSPAVAMDRAGDFVISWVSDGQDGSGLGIFAQRFSSTGQPQGGEFQVNSDATGIQSHPTVAMDATGDFVIAWQSLNQDGSHYGIYSQRYSASGATVGKEFRVNTFTTDDQSQPSVAMDAKGDFVVAWSSTNQDGNPYGIYAQRYDSKGFSQGKEFHVNTFTAGGQRLPSVAMDQAGDFVVAWTSFGQDGDGSGIFAQRYDAAGTKQGKEFGVNSYTPGSQSLPRLAMDASGDFTVAWNSYGEDGSGYGVFAQRYNAAGIAEGREFQVNTYTNGSQLDSAVAMDAVGDFVITWRSSYEDGSGYGIYAQRYKNSQSGHAPVGTSATITTLEDTTFTFNASNFGFSDPLDMPQNAFFAVKIATLPQAGSLTDGGTVIKAGAFVPVTDINAGKLKFVPVANANGTTYAAFTFQVQDNGGTANGAVDLDPTPRKMTISVTSVNDAPSGTAKTVTTLENTSYAFKVSDFGFSDVHDTPPNAFKAVKITTLPLVGSLIDNGIAVKTGAFIPVADIAAGRLKYSPARNGSGATYANFTFQVQDNGGTANGAVDLDPIPRKMTIAVTFVNSPPAGKAHTVSMLKNTTYAFKVTDFGFSDPDGNSLFAVKITALPLHGTLSVNGVAIRAGQSVSVADIMHGEFKFKPASNAKGIGYASFLFQVRDNGGTANKGVDTDPTSKKMTVNVS